MKSKEKIKVSIDKIFPYKNNNKLHTPEQIDQIRKSIADFNLVQDIVIDEKNEIVIGHGRFEAIKQLIEL